MACQGGLLEAGEEVSDFEAIRRKLLETRKPRPVTVRGLSTGSTLLNLACSGHSDWGFALGTYVFLVGDSASGKSWLSLSCLAEACYEKRFDNYRLIHDNAEDGTLMDVGRFFGRLEDRLEGPSEEGSSTTVEQFFYNLDDALAKGPCVYILDSMDALTTEEEDSKFDERKKASRNGREVSGSYGVSKAKLNSSSIRRILPRLRETGSILLIISQTRDNLGFGFEKKTRSGGHALRFYATTEIWSSIQQKLTAIYKGKKQQQGILAKLQIKKNRLTGREATVCVPIYWSLGIDDTGSCVEWLIDQGHWAKTGAKVRASEFDFYGGFERLVVMIQKGGLEPKLHELVRRVWGEIEAACAVERRNRYE